MKGWKRSSWCNYNTCPFVNQWPFMLIPLERNESFKHDYEICFRPSSLQVALIATVIWAHTCSAFLGCCPCSPALPLNMGLRKKIAEEANAERADVLGRLLSLLLVFAVNISSCVTLAVTSWLDFFPGICSNFLGMLRGEMKADGNEKCYNYWVS